MTEFDELEAKRKKAREAKAAERAKAHEANLAAIRLAHPNWSDSQVENEAKRLRSNKRKQHDANYRTTHREERRAYDREYTRKKRESK